MKHRSVFVAACYILALMLPGCAGYQLGSTLPPDMRSIFIPTFVNGTQDAMIEVDATNATIAEFQRDGTLRIVGEDMADLILECRLTSITLDPLRYSKTDKTQPNEYRLTLNANFLLTRGRSGQVISKGEVSGESTFVFSGSLTSAKKDAIPEASRDLAKSIVESVIETWW